MEDKMITVVFPGQGSQRPGMGRDFHDMMKSSRNAYIEASDALGWDVAALCFSEDTKLNLTEYVQPCILTTEIAMLRGLEERYGIKPRYFGGHSLGEYTAMVAAGVISLAEAVKVTQCRGNLMQKAVPVGIGGMAAVISEKIDIPTLKEYLSDLPIDIANINSTNQIVISGKREAIPLAERRLKAAMTENNGFRFVPLNVSAPFHSRFMGSIKESFKNALETISAKVNPEKAGNVTSNYTGIFHSGNLDDIIDRMVAQLSGTVQWVKNMHTLAARADEIIEIGPARPLREFFKTIGVACSSITTLSAARRVFEPATASD
ncbi:MAG: ACP S-malonyltransferase [Deltaproteobacteria bacterium]|nr:ACP S-malonyltransferase [Deltaproteobacteria bacterium]